MSGALGTVRVVGTGLVGTSLALALRAKGVDTVLWDPSPSAVALSRDLGAGRFAAADDEVALVVVAAPPDVVADVVASELATHPQAVVTDVASVKAQPLRQLTARGVDVSRYVGGHPLAGRERSGAVAARADLFTGRPWVLTPAASTDPEAVELVRRVVELTGAVVTQMPADEHDEAVAVVSHVPQVAASLVAARLREVPEPSVALAGQGLRDVTRIAASDPQLWTQILAGNAAAVARALHALRDDLDVVIAAVDALGADSGAEAPGARAAVARVVAAGNEGHARIPGKHGSAPTAYTPVVVLVPDRPGELARLLQAVGDAGVNLEDLRLEHSEGRPMALAEIDVLPAAAAGLAGSLRAGGWTVHL
ncbi:prephenate dehydrogenase [Angustibacter sp. Root456]|uniref:prephenate dehydrogenase n=1 Tax=Angustibacter sp. Root456 TaxID=1736539 RepID=UPI0006F72A49|nr:prephenate dehydrogenase [Angustibacter sp. Root456]KQX66476.1 prephenate dehydrogenase [Angustibacter sp. Root456]